MEWNFPADSHLWPTIPSDRSAEFFAYAPLHPATFESGQACVNYALALPSNYTHGYAYPLIVWFHEDGGNEQDVLEWLPHVSPQNYLGLGLRGPLPIANGLPGQCRWSTGPQHLHWLEDQLVVALMETAQQYSLHPERIVAAGIGRGATIALQMLLRRPDLFAAAACFNAELPVGECLDRWGQYSGRSLWLGHSRLLDSRSQCPAITAAGLLHAAGIDVYPRHYADEEWPLDTLGRDIDRWLMPRLCKESVIV